MPVRFEENSEYDRNYPWRQSYRSATFTPSADQLQTSAGLSSFNLGLSMEPPMQRKKRPTSQSRTETITSFDAERPKEEYMLLGNQTKFASNVQYKPRPNDVRRSLKEKHEESAPRDPPPAPRNPPPPPKVVVNTGAPKPKQVQKPKVQMVKEQATNTSARPAAQSVPPQRRQEQPQRKVEEPCIAAKSSSKVTKEKKPSPSLKQSTKGPTKRTNKGSFDEFAQTNMEKGITHSAQEAQRDYAMQYKAGIAPARMRGPKRVSEYQLQFKWKDGMKPSPVLAAEQVVYKSNPAVPPNLPARMSKTSEYNKSFKEWKMVPVPKEESGSTPKKRMKRSKSLESVTPDKRKAAGITRVTSDEDKRLVSESMNSLKLHFPHGKQKNVVSEYAVNYRAPTKFAYEDGAWKGADPPHIEPKQVELEGDEPDHPPSWFHEVRELRAKAAEYKKRAQGTHFGREHLAQLYAKQSDYWDTVSNSDTLSALDLDIEGGQKTPPKRVIRRAKPSKKSRSKEAWADDSASTVSGRSSRTLTPRGSICSAISEATLSEQRAFYANNVLDDESDEGRVPTPKLRASVPVMRHHLDRTTPAVGGALLVSPQTRRSQSQMSDNSEAFEVEEPKKVVHRKGKTQKKSKSREGSVCSEPATKATAKIPTYGMATRDNHVLVDEEASIDRPLQTSFVHSPEQDKVRRARQKFPNVDIPDTIQEDGGATFNKTRQNKENWEVKLDDIPARNGVEDDILSMSARSVASSCSLASETLERARKNRDEFWGDYGSVASNY